MLTPNYDHEIPEMTVEVVKAAFPKGNAVMNIRDELGPLFEDAEFVALYPKIGQPAESPARLALVAILQFMENLTDREAADAVRSRIDRKYLLSLELTDPGFHYSVHVPYTLAAPAGCSSYFTSWFQCCRQLPGRLPPGCHLHAWA